MSKVVLISPPYMKLSYPSYEMPLALTKGCDYMNPGLLICSSILDSKSISNKIIKINNLNDENETIKYLDDDTVLVGISCTCAWEYLESLKIAQIIKKNRPSIKIVISGWQIKSIKEKGYCNKLQKLFAMTKPRNIDVMALLNNDMFELETVNEFNNINLED